MERWFFTLIYTFASLQRIREILAVLQPKLYRTHHVRSHNGIGTCFFYNLRKQIINFIKFYYDFKAFSRIQFLCLH